MNDPPTSASKPPCVDLREQLQENVYGQPIVQEAVVNALKSHWRSDVRRKALTLSFHGWPGGGKNYVVRFIQENLYARGAASSFVHHFTARIHFPQSDKVEQYKVIETGAERCSTQISTVSVMSSVVLV